jgi:DNA helicase II / ATP-dependent DNA helicase PcrA
VVDGCIPSDMATGTEEELEEERRLLYVAMTRAREHLHLIVPHRFYVTQQSGGGDKHIYAGRSRFIGEAMAEKFERVTWPRADASGENGRRPDAPLLHVRDRARATWR